MEFFEITGGNSLRGEVSLHGAKNSALPILAAAVLVNGECILHNCPNLSDVSRTLDILKKLGCTVTAEDNTVTVNSSNISSYCIDECEMREMRSSILFLGSLLGRLKSACVYLPGGCEIGTRPIDMHLKALKQLGAEIEENGSCLCCKAERITGKKIILPYASVGATENIMLCTAVSQGTTTIINPAREPEISDLASFLNKCGAKISGAGESEIVIEGVEGLHSCEHTIIPDRILASTYMSACAATAGDIIIADIVPSHLAPVFPYFNEMGCHIYLDKKLMRVTAPKRLKRVKKINTLPYPGFPTDSQSPLAAALSVAKGTSVIRETVFENRFRYVSQLNRFGADIEVNDRIAVINGVKKLNAANVEATDLRGGAALVIAALAAEGVSTVSKIKHIDRGYEAFENGLGRLGANIKRISDGKENEEEKSAQYYRLCCPEQISAQA